MAKSSRFFSSSVITVGPYKPCCVGACLTFEHDLAEHGGVATGRAAVPSVVQELVLALADAHLDALADADHDIRVLAADASLLADQAGDVGADYARRYGVKG